MSVKLESAERYEALKSSIEAVTGETHTDLTEGVQALKDGYGQGGGGSEELAALETKIDESGVLDGTEQTLDEKVDALIEGMALLSTTFLLSFQNNKSIEHIGIYLSAPVTYMQSTFNGTSNLKTMVGINTSKVVNAQYAFANSGIVSIERPFDLSSLTITNMYSASIFLNANSLVDVRIVPNTIKTSMYITSSVLSDESIQSIVDGLADLTGGTQRELALNATVTAKLTEAQIATITSKNWVVA